MQSSTSAGANKSADSAIALPSSLGGRLTTCSSSLRAPLCVSKFGSLFYLHTHIHAIFINCYSFCRLFGQTLQN
jgi:hypothetical protein